MTYSEKEEILKQNGWYHWYSATYVVHPNICDFFDKIGLGYFGKDYTNYQTSIDEAYEIYLKCQINDK